MRSLIGTCTVLLLATVALAQPPAGDGTSISILRPGEYVDAAPVKSGEVWWVLYATPGDGVRLRYTPLSVSTVPDYGERVQADGFADEDVVLLFRGTREIPRGPVATVFHGELSLSPGLEVNLGKTVFRKGSISRDQLSVQPFRRIMISSAPINEPTLGDYIIELHHDDETKQMLFQANWQKEPGGYTSFNDVLPALLWAGDLDKDDRLDLLLAISEHYAASRFALYLSSYAQPGELVHLVAEAEGPGGC